MLTSEQRRRIDGLSDAEARLFLTSLRERARASSVTAWEPYPWQVPPANVPTLGMWLMLGGRGTGKTEAAARYMDAHVNGPPCDTRLPGGHRMAIVAPTFGDAVEACVNGPSGLKALNPSIRMREGAGGAHVIWPNGARARLLGCYSPEDIERLRAAGNNCAVWLEEVAAMRHLGPALEHTGLGLRIGPNPHYVASTTPKPRRELKALIKDPTTLITRGRTRDAVRLNPDVRARYESLYGGTRLGRQELDAELIEDVEGALWTWTLIVYRPVNLEDLRRVVVAVDPAVTANGGSDETGIVVVGVDHLGTFHVLADLSGRYTPDGWAKRAVAAYHQYGCDAIIAERNQGGDMVTSTLRQQPGLFRVRTVHATRGKQLRAEPISSLYEQGRVTHAQPLPHLEDQMTSFTGADQGPGTDDRVDALVHGLTELAGATTLMPVRSFAT